jgi:hypothetical protein
MAGLCPVAKWVPDEVTAPRMIRAHRSGCLRCQVDAVRTRGLLRDLASLRHQTLTAPPGLHAAVMTGLGHQKAGPRSSRIRTALTAAAGAVVAAAAVAGGLVLRRQRAVG